MATFQNQATLTYNGVTRSSNVVSGELLETLTVTKTAAEGTYSAGSDVTYAVSLVNSGTIDFTGLTLTDDLGAYTNGTLTLVPLDYVDGSVLYYVGGALQATPTVSTSTGELVISGISGPAGGNAMIVYVTRANAYAPPIEGSTVTNTVTVSGGGITPVMASETISVATDAELSIVKSASPLNVPENGNITYTFALYNSGNTETTEEGNPVISDVFDPILSDITVTLDGVALAEGTGYTYDEATGEFSTADGAITVPAAKYTQDETTGAWTADPGSVVLTVSGTV